MKCTSPYYGQRKITVEHKKRIGEEVLRIKKSYDVGVPVQVRCGYCMACRLTKSREWAFRLRAELPYHNGASFINLTYDDENLPPNGSLNKKHLQDYFKRFRKKYNENKLKYFASGEYGETTFRPHYHVILFGITPKDIYTKNVFNSFSKIVGKERVFEKGSLWPFGSVLVGTVTKDSILYVTKYITKKLNGKEGKIHYGDMTPPFQLQSLGLGLDYAKDNYQEIAENLSVKFNGQDIGIPRYYKKKLKFSEHEIRKKAQVSHEEYLNEVESKGLKVTNVDIQRNKNILSKVNLSKKGIL